MSAVLAPVPIPSPASPPPTETTTSDTSSEGSSESTDDVDEVPASTPPPTVLPTMAPVAAPTLGPDASPTTSPSSEGTSSGTEATSIVPVGTSPTLAPTLPPTSAATLPPTSAATTEETDEDSSEDDDDIDDDVDDDIDDDDDTDEFTDAPAIPADSFPTDAPFIAPTKEPAPQMVPNDVQVRYASGGKKKHSGFQSNWGVSYSGGMALDVSRNAIYLTGTTFVPSTASDSWARSTCFAKEINMAEMNVLKSVPDPLPAQAANKVNSGVKTDFVVPDFLGAKEQLNCHAIHFGETDQVLYVSGADERDAEKRDGNIDSFLNAYNRTPQNPEWHFEVGPKDLDNPTRENEPFSLAKIRHPVGLATGKSAIGEDEVLVLSVSSTDGLLTEDYEETGDAKNSQNFENVLLPPGSNPQKTTPKRGSNYFLTYQRYKVVENRLQYLSGEDILSRSQDGNVIPTGVANMNTRGSEYVFVGHVQGSHPQRWDKMSERSSLTDMDGFAALIHFPMTRPTFKEIIRYSSIERNPSLDDYVNDICAGPVDPNTKTVEHYYVVGSTFGTMPPGEYQNKIKTNLLSGNANDPGTLSAFVSKIDYKTRTVLWNTQLYGERNGSVSGADAQAFGCHAMISDPTTLYVGGNVYDGAVMISNKKSAGGDDIWVAQLDTEDGSLRWIEQTGSSGNDSISKTKGIRADINGDAVVYGETNGDFFRKGNAAKGVSDIFITTFNKSDGYTPMTIEQKSAANRTKGLIGGGVALILLSILGAGYFFFGRPKRRGQSRSSGDGVFQEDNIMPTFADDPEASIDKSIDSNGNASPPESAFKDDPDYRPGRNFV